MMSDTTKKLFCLSTVGLAICVCPNPSIGDVDYRIVDLGEIGFVPLVVIAQGSFAINNHGEVAYARDTAISAGSEIRAWIWLPEDAYTLDAGRHDLADLAEQGESAAWDINDAGIVVGQIDDHQVGPNTDSRGMIWELGATITTCELGAHVGGGWSVAWAINNDDDPWVVGTALKSSTGACDKENFAFEVEYDGTCGPLTELVPLDDHGSYARDVNTHATERHVAGFSTKAILASICLEDEGLCSVDRDPVRWENGGGPLQLQTQSGDNGHMARGNNDAGNFVGEGQDNGVPCRARALFWDDDLANPEVLDVDDANDQAHAEAINNNANPSVVGWNLTDSAAWRWEFDGADWDNSNLNDVTNCSAWDLEQAHDINDDGWIVGYGTINSTDHAFVLVPFESCRSDIDEDGSTGTSDLLLLLGAWGACPEAVICEADLDGDCEVGTSDLLLLLGAWGPCVVIGPAPKVPKSVQDCLDRYPNDMEALIDCLESL